MNKSTRKGYGVTSVCAVKAAEALVWCSVGIDPDHMIMMWGESHFINREALVSFHK